MADDLHSRHGQPRSAERGSSSDGLGVPTARGIRRRLLALTLAPFLVVPAGSFLVMLVLKTVLFDGTSWHSFLTGTAGVAVLATAYAVYENSSEMSKYREKTALAARDLLRVAGRPDDADGPDDSLWQAAHRLGSEVALSIMTLNVMMLPRSARAVAYRAAKEVETGGAVQPATLDGVRLLADL
ncbi:hypothetical protein ABT072_48665 [Streptomyces sp. NPDC002589]|uniref:hypothetical protein n=1 Tax=Streptomyces sp. NPDC002589 TaxID=3154420 RepID=UPI00331C5705